MGREDVKLIYHQDRSDDTTDDDDDMFQDPHMKSLQLDSVMDLCSRPSPWTRLVYGMIFANTLLMVVQAEYPLHDSHTWYWCETFFLTFFFIEVMVRLAMQGCQKFFCNPHTGERGWNWFDFVIVILGIVLVIPWHRLVKNHTATERNLLPAILLLRGMRILRVIRLLKGLRQLHLLIRGMFKSFEAVFWILILGLLIILIFAVAAATVVGHHSVLWSKERCGDKCGPHDQERIEQLFGDLGSSMWTMFQFVTLDEWSSIIRLVSKRLWIMKWFFLAYTLIASFALISLLTGVMAEHIMSESEEQKRDEAAQEIDQYISSLQEAFLRRGGSKTGKGLGIQELQEMLDDPVVESRLRKIGVFDAFSNKDLEDVFRAMDLDCSGDLSWSEFEHGLRNIKGTASARELSLVRADVQRLLRLVDPGEVQRRGDVQRPKPQARPRSCSSAAREDADCAARLSAMEHRFSRLESAIMTLMQAEERYINNPGSPQQVQGRVTSRPDSPLATATSFTTSPRAATSFHMSPKAATSFPTSPQSPDVVVQGRLTSRPDSPLATARAATSFHMSPQAATSFPTSSQSPDVVVWPAAHPQMPGQMR